MNNLERLLQQPTYIVLGAGASKAYGFPLWEELKNCVLGMLQKELTTSEDKDRLKVCERWHELIVENDLLPKEQQKTIDHIIEENSINRVQRQIVLNIMKRVLADCEKKDKNSTSTGWVEELVQLYVALLNEKKKIGDGDVFTILANTRVVTLNYERCFEEHFYNPLYRFLCYSEFEDRNFIMSFKSELQSKFFYTRHPHGAIGAGSLEKIEGGTIDRVQCVSKVRSGGYKSNVGAFTPYGQISFDVDLDLVGDDPLDENYSEINENIEESSNCVVMGLSGIGLAGCQINWQKYGRIVYFGSDDFEFSGAKNVQRINDEKSEKKQDMQMIDWLASLSV